MDEKTYNQDEEFNASVADAPSFDADDEMFDMGAMAEKEATERFEAEQKNEKMMFDDIEGFAHVFPEGWVLMPPKEQATVDTIISKQLAKKAKK